MSLIKFFDDSSPYNTAIEWSWSFGDGSFSKEQNPTHIYNKMGDYTVELTVKDGNDYSIERKENFINVEGNKKKYYELVDFEIEDRINIPENNWLNVQHQAVSNRLRASYMIKLDIIVFNQYEKSLLYMTKA